MFGPQTPLISNLRFAVSLLHVYCATLEVSETSQPLKPSSRQFIRYTLLMLGTQRAVYSYVGSDGYFVVDEAFLVSVSSKWTETSYFSFIRDPAETLGRPRSIIFLRLQFFCHPCTLAARRVQEPLVCILLRTLFRDRGTVVFLTIGELRPLFCCNWIWCYMMIRTRFSFSRRLSFWSYLRHSTSSTDS